jgi:hypothetical protein
MCSQSLCLAFSSSKKRSYGRAKRKVENFFSPSCCCSTVVIFRNILLCLAAISSQSFLSCSTAELSLDFNVLFVFRQHPKLKSLDATFPKQRKTFSFNAPTITSKQTETHEKLLFSLRHACLTR